jgi:hypothetical protein
LALLRGIDEQNEHSRGMGFSARISTGRRLCALFVPLMQRDQVAIISPSIDPFGEERDDRARARRPRCGGRRVPRRRRADPQLSYPRRWGGPSYADLLDGPAAGPCSSCCKPPGWDAMKICVA